MLISSRPEPKKKFSSFLIFSSAFILLFFIVGIFFFRSEVIGFTYNNVVARTYIKSMGIGGVDRSLDPIRIIKDFSTNLVNSPRKSKEIDQMIIDIKFKDFIKLRDNREIAINEGMINKTHFEMVPAKLRVGEKKFRANLRLKGWYLDHIASDQWSLRVKVRNDNVDGIRDFSINGPFTRDFQSSPLINKAMRYKGILAPRDNYYEVILNGDNLGIMYFEERYSEQFTESSYRPFGPILTYDEKSKRMSFLDSKKFWGDDKNLEFIYSNIDLITENPEQYLEIFDQNLWAEYLAITFLFQCFHGNTELNLSYYFHPI